MAETAATSSSEPQQIDREIRRLSIMADQLKDVLSGPGTSEDARQKAFFELAKLSTTLDDIAKFVSQKEEDHANMQALAEVGRTINSALSTEDVLRVVMDSLIRLTGAERAFLMLRDKNNDLSIRVGRNWGQENLEIDEAKISRSVAERVADTGEPVLTSNAQEDPRFQKQDSVIGHHLRSILCVPLKVRDHVIGVIYADNRIRTGLFTQKELNLLSAFADQAAIALENANLFEGLQESNKNLQKAYNSTLEGWAKALELRDQETQGHTERVTDLTLQFAMYLGIEGKSLTNIRRGAILHDVGKMGIPDAILLKHGPLTEEERTTMEQHPLYAKQMLSKIDFLHDAMEIPMYHHEHWDGNGYPDGLKGEDIPLSARIFAVVDVWDALVSDRPYRGGLPEMDVLEMIKKESGKHFDPMVVAAFIDMMCAELDC